jgi:hypothetical protein
VIPNVCPYISAEFCRIPSVREAERRLHEIEVQRVEIAGQREEIEHPQRQVERQSIQAAREIMTEAAQKLSQCSPLFSRLNPWNMGHWHCLWPPGETGGVSQSHRVLQLIRSEP